MVFTMMVLAGRKDGITHEEFKRRYEQHMLLVEEICGDAMPLKHTRWYPPHGADGKPILLSGNTDEMYYDVIATITFEDKAGMERFSAALTAPEADARIMADEAGFWDRNKMHVTVGGDVKVWEKK
ncbi:HypE protein [Colletotrichum karsti]|uniref:HypE protein n=1 Tax=Colletotrichum karsti TaxID=1095194 RepID=A0A9P6LIX1_9PEZI|nr:HypE protein [Colletotrichum karsti]KAF9874576.1 HypE protein [Colletotrichum karsti]